MFRLAHLSDIHLAPLPQMRRRQLMSKRITGYVNWQRNRAAAYQPEVLEKLVADLANRGADHVTVTGDLINLGLDAEMDNARRWLESLGDPRDISVVCGNHDAYVPGALSKALSIWQPWIGGDDGRHVYGGDDFPVVRRRGRISIIGCNSARATMPFVASGFFRAPQAKRLAEILEKEGAEGRCRVILIHHPPITGAAPVMGRLVGQSLLRKVVKEHGAELILHGHTHIDSINMIRGRNGPVPVVGVPSGGQAPVAAMRRPAARYNLFELSENGRGWQINLQEYGYRGPGSGVDLVGEMELRVP